VAALAAESERHEPRRDWDAGDEHDEVQEAARPVVPDEVSPIPTALRFDRRRVAVLQPVGRS
jgi:hypothetical protein